jgi:hypothetical protein
VHYPREISFLPHFLDLETQGAPSTFPSLEQKKRWEKQKKKKKKMIMIRFQRQLGIHVYVSGCDIEWRAGWYCRSCNCHNQHTLCWV